MKSDGESCGKNRVHRLMKQANIKAVRGYKRHPGFHSGTKNPAAPNVLEREFSIVQPDRSWVTDFTYIRTYEGWLYLTVVIDLFSRKVVGWTMKSSPKTDLVIDALLMAIWRRRPKGKVLIHSDQGVQYASGDWRSFLKEHNMEISMSRKETAMTMRWQKASSRCLRKIESNAKSTRLVTKHAQISSIILSASRGC